MAMLIPRLALAASRRRFWLRRQWRAAHHVFPRGIRSTARTYAPARTVRTYQSEFTKAAAQQPPSATLAEAQRLDREGVRYCDMQQLRVTQGVNEIAEALHMIGVQPSL